MIIKMKSELPADAGFYIFTILTTEETHRTPLKSEHPEDETNQPLYLITTNAFLCNTIPSLLRVFSKEIPITL
jgi:hypothetical protein